MQVELLDRKKWKTRMELANAMFDYFEIWHNRRVEPVEDGDHHGATVGEIGGVGRVAHGGDDVPASVGEQHRGCLAGPRARAGGQDCLRHSRTPPG